jgi:hypothetical protein
VINVSEVVSAAKLPRSLLPWNGKAFNARIYNGDAFLFDHTSIAGLHLISEDEAGDCWGGYTVMDDSDREIRRHMCAVVEARGRILKTGLGFGCFVRACLRKPEVEHIDVVEISRDVIDHFGAEFRNNSRVTIHHADAFEFPLQGKRWDLVWHDIYCDGNDGLARLHTKLLRRYRQHCDKQGAWAMPRSIARAWLNKTGQRLVGSPKHRRVP